VIPPIQTRRSRAKRFFEEIVVSWALNSVSQGGDIVLVAQDRVYKLQGPKDQVLRFMSAKVRGTGRLDGSVRGRDKCPGGERRVVNARQRDLRVFERC
jgi:hypothetical protein